MRKKRREVSVYDVQMSLTPEGLAKIERKARDKYHDRCFCGLRRGLHVFVLSLLAVPFAWVYATLSAFYIGTLTWEVLNRPLFLLGINSKSVNFLMALNSKTVGN